MSARGKARKRALDVLYAADLRGLPPLDVLAAEETAAGRPVNPHTRRLVEGVAAHAARIDELLATYSLGWTLDRMPPVDRNLLRLGAFELLGCDDVPDAVVLAEVVALASELSTDGSAAFVNGLLARLRDLRPALDG